MLKSNLESMKPKILTFHDVFPESRLGINTFSTDKFERLISLLKNRYTFVTVSKILADPDNDDYLALTFDDGYESVFEYVFPILKKHHIPASVMVICGFVDRENKWDPSPVNKPVKHLSGDQIKKLVDAGWEMAPHGFSHFAYTVYNLPLIEKDMIRCIQYFEKNKLTLPGYISLPFGIVDHKVIHMINKRFNQILGMMGLFPGQQVIERFPVYRFEKISNLVAILESWPGIKLSTRVFLASIHSGARLSGRWQHWFKKKIMEEMEG